MIKQFQHDFSCFAAYKLQKKFQRAHKYRQKMSQQSSNHTINQKLLDVIME